MPACETTLPFVKMQGVGNDFVLLDRRGLPPLDGAALAPRLCARRFGIGADGLLMVEDPTDSTIADLAMRMHNPDGTPDFCGNGLRCVARYVADGAGAGDADLRIQTRAGVRQARVRHSQQGVSVTVGMGRPRFAPADIPMCVQPADGGPVMDYGLAVDGETLPVTALSTGTTHVVVFVERLPDDARFDRLSPLISEHPLFPERASIMWTVVEGPGRLRLRIYERGAGETLGCGSGACAAAVAARLHGLTGECTAVASKGGELLVEWREGEETRMTGPAEYVFEGRFCLGDRE